MLVFISGTYGVGKSFLIENLVKKGVGLVLPTYITRPLREHDFGRIRLEPEEFLESELNNEFVSINKHFDCSYGIKLRDIENALISEVRFLIDFPLSKIDVFEKYVYKLVVLNPPSSIFLANTLKAAGRESRIIKAVHDYESIYQNYQANVYSLVLVNSFINYHQIENQVIEFLNR